MSSILNNTIPQRSLLVATAGHVDHGKSTLIKCLTGTDPDRLPQEKSRGMTLDLGFASTDGFSFIDCPGHDGLIRHMVAGTNAVDGVCLVIAANEGVCEQTREHAHILEWLQVKRVFLVISKTDLILDPEELELVCDDILDQTRKLFSENVSVQAATFSKNTQPDNLLALMKVFFQAERTVSQNSYDRFFIDRSFVINGTGTVVTGSFFEGACRPGEKYIVWFPSVRKPKVVTLKAIRNGSQKTEEQNQVGRVAFALDGVRADEVTRGSLLLLTTRLPLLSDNLLLDLDWAVEPKKQQTLILQVGTLSLEAKLRLHPTGVWRCHLKYPAPLRRHDKIILRQPSRLAGIGHCVAGGIILDAFAPAQKITEAPPLDDHAFIVWAKSNFHQKTLLSPEFWSEKTGRHLEKVPFLAVPPALKPIEPKVIDQDLLNKIQEQNWQALVPENRLNAAHNLVRQGHLYHIGGRHFIHQENYKILVSWLHEHFHRHEDLALSDARDFFKTGRKSFLQILEFCDRNQMTFRKNLVRKKFRLPPPLAPEADRR